MLVVGRVPKAVLLQGRTAVHLPREHRVGEHRLPEREVVDVRLLGGDKADRVCFGERLDQVKQVKPHTNGECFLVLGSGSQVKVSRSYRDVVARFCGGIFGAGRRFDLVPTRANGQPAFGTYLRGSDGIAHGVGLIVLTLSADRIWAMTRFENTVLPWFGLPRTLSSR